MNGKSRYLSSLLIATVAAFGYYILTDFNLHDIKLKTFSSLGGSYRMYAINNSVKQKKLPLPKVVYTYNVQDELKSPPIDVIASVDVDEFIEGLTVGLSDALKEKKVNKNEKISSIAQYGMKESGSEIIPVGSTQTLPPQTDCQMTLTVQPEITSEDIEMVVSNVSEKNVKKIEECFKKITVILGNENGNMKSAIVNVFQNPNKMTRNSYGSTCTSTTTETRRMKKVAPVASSEDDEDATYEDEESDE